MKKNLKDLINENSDDKILDKLINKKDGNNKDDLKEVKIVDLDTNVSLDLKVKGSLYSGEDCSLIDKDGKQVGKINYYESKWY